MFRLLYLVLAQVMLVAFGLCSIAWSVAVIYPLAAASGLDQVSGHILQTEPFRLPLLQRLANKANESGGIGERPESLREIAIVNERLFEQDLFEAKRNALDDQAAVTELAIERSLEHAPADPFLWLSLYWVRTANRGFSTDNLPLLRMSYLTGPNEGWIATRRNRFSFIVFRFLAPDLARSAFSEFAALVSSGFDGDTADIFVGPAWPQREQLLLRIENLPADAKQRFARRVYDLGYNVDVPGVPRFGDRPWR